MSWGRVGLMGARPPGTVARQISAQIALGSVSETTTKLDICQTVAVKITLAHARALCLCLFDINLHRGQINL